MENDDKTSVIDELLMFDPNIGRTASCKFIITPKVLSQVEHLAGLGLGLEEISDMLNISVATLCRRRKDTVKFDIALRKGRMKAQVKISNALFNKALDHNDTAAMIFFLKNRSPEKWSDKRKIDHTSSDGSVTIPTQIIIEAKEVTNDNVKLTKNED